MPSFRNFRRFSVLGISVCAGCSLKWIFWGNRPVFAAGVESEKKEDNSAENELSKLQLKHVQVLFRHGARTPLHLIRGVEQATYKVEWLIRPVPHTLFEMEFINKDDGGPLEDSKYDAHYAKTKLKGGCTSGLLTYYGQDQMYMLGKRLRKEYMEKANFIDDFDPKLVDLTTTHMKRTKESLRCVLAGLFGAENLRKQEPILVKSNHSKDEIMVPCPSICPVFRQINHSAMIHGTGLPEFRGDKMKLEQALGAENYIRRGVNFIDVRDDLVARKTHGLALPEKITPEIYDMVNRNAAKLIYYANCGQHEIERMVASRLSMGRLMKKFIDNIHDAISGECEVKMHVYSGHDTTVLPVLAILDLKVDEWPPFGADIIFELYEDSDKKHYIQVKYLGQPQIVRGCSKELCPLEEFLEGVGPYQIDQKEFKEICHSNILEQIAKEMLAQEEAEAEEDDEESQERSEYAAGL